MADETKAAEKKKRTRKVGGLQAFTTDWKPVENWPDRVTTMEAAKAAYIELALSGRIMLVRQAGSLEGTPQTTMRFSK